MSLGVYGLGRFGYFYAEMLSRLTPVAAYSRNPERAVPEGVQKAGLDELCACDTIVLCVSISAMPAVLKGLAPRLRPGQLVMDTCSVKVQPAAWMQEYLPGEVSLMASHPMFGPDSARGSLQDLPITLWPLRASDSQLDSWRTSFSALGLRVLEMSPERHDRIAAYTQGVTHFIGRVLEELESQDSEIATRGYKQLLEVKQQTCNDPWQLFLDLQRYNPFTGDMRRDLARALDTVMRKIQVDSPQGRT